MNLKITQQKLFNLNNEKKIGGGKKMNSTSETSGMKPKDLIFVIGGPEEEEKKYNAVKNI